jgi:hypothetical protein
MQTLRAREGENFPLQVLWLDSYGRPLSVSNVTYEVFYYIGANREYLVTTTAMAATDDSYRYLIYFTPPSGSAGLTLFCTYRATYEDDDSDLIQETTLQIEKSIVLQKMGVSF